MEIDWKLQIFKKKWGIACPDGCGRCCEISSERIDATIFEFFPLSIHLWEKGEAERYIEKLQTIREGDRCVLYVPGSREGLGRCGFYRYRPVYCRLFGFFVIEGKDGKPRLSLCQWIKKSIPSIEEKLLSLDRPEGDLPMGSSYVRRVLTLYPLYTHELVPINEALKKALEATGLKLLLLRRTRGNISHR